MSSNAVGDALIAAAKYRFVEESLPRIEKCFGLLTDEEIWFRPNSETVSVGNLVLHLCGNVRQWMIFGLGGGEDKRVRALEFSERGPLPREELLGRLRQTVKEAEAVLDGIDRESLHAPRRVQGETETGAGIILHVVEHFSYHTGQITYFVKSRKNIDTGYYAGQDLNVRG
ncbi:MAG: DinB family protein [Candidatus Hydrogenedentota bacterium]